LSRIYEQLKTAQKARDEAALPKGAVRSSPPHERRRSPRLALRIPVFVYGYLPGRKPFHEEAELMHVNSDGGLLILSTNLRLGQKLLLTNKLNQTEQKSFVVYFKSAGEGKFEVGVEFAQRCPEFVQTSPRKAKS